MIFIKQIKNHSVALGLFLIATTVFFQPVETWAGEKSAKTMVADFQAVLLETMKQAKFLSVEERFEELEPAIDETFHLQLMAHIVTGNHWKSASKDERANFVAAFRNYNIANLASLLSSYSGQVFEFAGEQDGPQKTLLVRTNLKDPDGSIVKIAYVMRKFKEGWRSVDVILDDGISEMQLRKSEYRQTLEKEGLAKLSAILNDKVKELLAEE